MGSVYKRKNGVYYTKMRNADGELVRISTRTRDRDEALRVLARLEADDRQRGSTPSVDKPAPGFSELALRLLREGCRHLAKTTRDERERALCPKRGHLAVYFGSTPVNQIGRARLMEWWEREVQGKGRASKTGFLALDHLSAVFEYACDHEWIEDNPVPPFRQRIHRRLKSTKAGREQAAKRGYAIETGKELAALVREARVLAGEPGMHRGYVALLLMLDGGMRWGEAVGLCWDDVRIKKREIRVCQSLARGQYLTTPKSGRARYIPMSLRLRRALVEHADRVARGVEPGSLEPDSFVVNWSDPHNMRRRFFRPVTNRAGFERLAMKDLRTTFASQLVTQGVQLQDVSRWLGHSTIVLTQSVYAHWLAERSRVEPVRQEPEELPVDLLARIGPVHDWELPMELAILRGPDETQQGGQKAQAGLDRDTLCTDRVARREGFEPPTLRFEAQRWLVTKPALLRQVSGWACG